MSSRLMVAKKLSATALSQHSPFRATDRITPLALRRAASSVLVYWQPRSGRKITPATGRRWASHRQGVFDEAGAHVIRQGPAGDPAAGQVDDRGQAGPAFPGHNVSDVTGITLVCARPRRE